MRVQILRCNQSDYGLAIFSQVTSCSCGKPAVTVFSRRGMAA